MGPLPVSNDPDPKPKTLIEKTESPCPRYLAISRIEHRGCAEKTTVRRKPGQAGWEELVDDECVGDEAKVLGSSKLRWPIAITTQVKQVIPIWVVESHPPRPHIQDGDPSV